MKGYVALILSGCIKRPKVRLLTIRRRAKARHALPVGRKMKNFFVSTFVLFVASGLLAGQAAADYTVTCHHDLPGSAERRRDVVTVKGATTLAQACAILRSDPLYGEYNWRTCVATDGQGTCANPGGGPPTGGTGPGGGPPTGGIGMPPSPPIGPVSVEPNINRPGLDYASVPLSQADIRLCSSMCERDPRCAAYTYVHPGYQGPNAMCWLKSQVPQPVSHPCCISGVR
jgi:PAN domain